VDEVSTYEDEVSTYEDEVSIYVVDILSLAFCKLEFGKRVLRRVVNSPIPVAAG